MGQAVFRWVVEKRVLLQTLTGDYDVDEMRRQIPRFEAILQEGIPSLYLIIDQTGMTSFPKKFREPIQMMEPLNRKYDVQWTIIITSNSMFRFFGSIVSNVFKVQFRAVATLDNAYELIGRIEPTLTPLLYAPLSQPDKV